MQQEPTHIPIVMTFSENDPSGGSGIQADIETLASMGCHCTPIVTAITARDDTQLKAVAPCHADLLKLQAQTTLETLKPAAFKIGLLGTPENVQVVHDILIDYPDIPIVLTPFANSEHYPNQNDPGVMRAIHTLLLPLCTVYLPSSEDMAHFPNSGNLESSIQEILEKNVKYVLTRHPKEAARKMINTLYSKHRQPETFTWDKLHLPYHGSNYTLAASIAGLFAQNIDPLAALYEAQEYTWGTLNKGYQLPNLTSYLPNRFFWAHSDASPFNFFSI